MYTKVLNCICFQFSGRSKTFLSCSTKGSKPVYRVQAEVQVLNNTVEMLSLKGLSHVIDFKHFDKNLQN
jgi:hypothetical protein